MIEEDYYGDRYRWFVGVVKELSSDGARVKVRIFGIHPTEDIAKVSDGDLPYALVLLPTTQPDGTHHLREGMWVSGFFADGIDSQQPVIVGVIRGGQNSVNNSPQQGQSANPNSPSTNSSNPTTAPSSSNPDTSGTNPGGAAPTSPPTTQLSGGSNDQKIFNYFWEKLSASGKVGGNLKAICAATVGNIWGESKWNPKSFNGNDQDKKGNSAKSVGICQWRGDPKAKVPPGGRLKTFMDFCGMTAIPASGADLPPLERQLDYLWHEITQTSEKQYFNKVLAGSSVEECLEGWIGFERPGFYNPVTKIVNKADDSWKERLAKANKAYGSLSYTGGSGGTS